MYKGREDVEQAFDAMKNRLESDKTYLRSDEAVRGYFLATFLAMRIYFKILEILSDKNLMKQISGSEKDIKEGLLHEIKTTDDLRMLFLE